VPHNVGSTINVPVQALLTVIDKTVVTMSVIHHSRRWHWLLLIVLSTGCSDEPTRQQSTDLRRDGVYQVYPGQEIQPKLDAAAIDDQCKTVRVHAGVYRPSSPGQALIWFNARQQAWGSWAPGLRTDQVVATPGLPKEGAYSRENSPILVCEGDAQLFGAVPKKSRPGSCQKPPGEPRAVYGWFSFYEGATVEYLLCLFQRGPSSALDCEPVPANSNEPLSTVQ